ncbi:UNVERIFIED_CONTAM: hypothetical protein RMT77_011737 [Armadillidium vulgare]
MVIIPIIKEGENSSTTANMNVDDVDDPQLEEVKKYLLEWGSSSANSKSKRKSGVYFDEPVIYNTKNFIKCFTCAFETNNKLLLKRHSIDHFDNLIECSECSFKTNRMKSLNHHLSKHFSTKLYKCKDCNYESFSFNKLMIHNCQKRVQRKRIFRCFLCKEEVRTRSNLRLHLKSHNKIILETIDCFTDKQALVKNNAGLHIGLNDDEILSQSVQESVEIVSDVDICKGVKRKLTSSATPKTKKFFCSYCKFTAKSEDSINIHMIENHVVCKMEIDSDSENIYDIYPDSPVNILQCPKCSFETTEETDYIYHLGEHFEMLSCPECSFQTHMKRKLNDHIKLHATHELLECQECDFKTIESQTFHDHVLDIHSGTRFLKCIYCSYETNEENKLVYHFQTHPELADCPECNNLDEKLCKMHKMMHTEIFRCQFCNYDTNKKSNIKRHIETLHTKMNLFKCSKCDFATRERNELRDHSLDEHERVIKCTECSMKVSSKSYKQHLRNHSDIKLYTCATCAYETNRKDHFNRHSCRAHAKEFKCSKCKFQTEDRDDLTDHMKTHLKTKALPKNKNQMFACPLCPFKVRLKTHLKRHLRQAHAKEKFYGCSRCSFEAKNRSELRSHVLAEHVKKVLNCPYCGFKTTTKYYKQHLRNHSYIKLFYCPLCTYETNSKSHIKRHTLQVHCKTNEPEKKIKVADENAKCVCPVCNYETLAGGYQSHIMTHSNMKMYKYFCSICDFEARTNHSLQKHFREVHPNVKRFQCQKCPFKTSERTELSRHVLNVHTTLRCPDCEFETFLKSKLKAHIANMHLETFSCTECDFTTKREEKLNSHMKSHNRPKVFQCSECDYTSRRRYHVIRHLLIHTDMKLISCPKCDFKTKSNEYLKNHMVIHMEEKLLKCPDCDYRTNRKRHLKKHSLVHSKTVTIPMVKVSDSTVELKKRRLKRTSHSHTQDDFFEYMI